MLGLDQLSWSENQTNPRDPDVTQICTLPLVHLAHCILDACIRDNSDFEGY